MFTKNIILFLLSSFIFNIQSNKIYVNSIHKCGTNLLFKCINILTKKKPRVLKTEDVINKDFPNLPDNEFLVCHLPYNKICENKLIKNKYKSFFIYRDPRDQIISYAFWVFEYPELYDIYKNKGVNPVTIGNLIDILITEVNELYSTFMPWTKSKIVCSVKFENLVGPLGKGSLQSQYNEIKKICDHLNISNNIIQYCANNLFGGTGTFRKGEIGRWKKYFSQKQKNAFKKIAGQLLIDLGYEKNFNW